MNQTIDVKHVASGERFTGTVAEPVVVGNTVAVPSGSTATGEILLAHRRGMFKGKSMMALTLTQLEVNGTQYRIDTSNLSRTKSGKGRRSAAFIGGGAGMGMLIGGVATGGVGLLVGGLAGGGAGALGAAFTGNRDLAIPAESVVSFRLQDGLTLAPDAPANPDISPTSRFARIATPAKIKADARAFLILLPLLRASSLPPRLTCIQVFSRITS